MVVRCILMVILTGFIVVAGSAAQQDIEARALKLEYQLMAPCCYGGTVAGHDSGIVRQIRQDIRTRLNQGMSERQILDAYVAQYSERILAAPPSRGFHVMAYVLPPVLLILGLFVLLTYLRRFRGRPEPITVAVDPRMIAQIEQDLQKQRSAS